MKTRVTLLVLMAICALTGLHAQFIIPDEDLIMGKSGVWLPKGGSNTDGTVSNPWMYFNNQHLLYHYETPTTQHTQFYLIEIKLGGEYCHYRDSCITIYCYDSAQSAYLNNRPKTDRPYPNMIVRVNYAGGQINILPNGQQSEEYYTDVDIDDVNVTGGFHSKDKKSSKALIPALLAKNKKIEYEGSPVDDVPFAHAHINWSKLAIETKEFSNNGLKLKQDSLKLVERKSHYDSLYYVPDSIKKQYPDSLKQLALNDYWVEFIEKGDTTKEPQASIISLLKDKNMGRYKYHFFKMKPSGRFCVAAGNTSRDCVFYGVDIKKREVVSLEQEQLGADLLPIIFRD